MELTNTSRNVRIIMYIVLFASALASFALGDLLWNAARGGAFALWIPLLAPISFTVFVIIYAVDRWLLVRRRGYPAGRALFQVGFSVVFLTLLWPGHAAQLRQSKASKHEDTAVRLMRTSDAEFRAAGCELAGLRGDMSAREVTKKLAAIDPSLAVRQACQRAAARIGEPPTETP